MLVVKVIIIIVALVLQTHSLIYIHGFLELVDNR